MTDSSRDAITEHYQQIQALTPADQSVKIADEAVLPLSTFLSLGLFIFFFVFVFLGFLPLVIERFRDFKRFQMALILSLIGAALPLSMGLLYNQSSIYTKAVNEETPNNIEITNVDSISFQVEWNTSKEQYGAIRYGLEATSSALNNTELEINGLARTKIHNLKLEGLNPDTTYYFEVLSGSRWYDNSGVPLSVSTLPLQ